MLTVLLESLADNAIVPSSGLFEIEDSQEAVPELQKRVIATLLRIVPRLARQNNVQIVNSVMIMRAMPRVMTQFCGPFECPPEALWTTEWKNEREG